MLQKSVKNLVYPNRNQFNFFFLKVRPMVNFSLEMWPLSGFEFDAPALNECENPTMVGFACLYNVCRFSAFVLGSI